MKKLAIPLAVIIGAAIGAGGFFAASKLGGGEPSVKPASAEEVAELRKGMAKLQAEVADLRSRPSLQDALNDPATREQLATIVYETRTPGRHRPRPVKPGTETWRRQMAERCRQGYAAVVAEACKTMKLSTAQAAAVRPIFDQLFSPVETQLKSLEEGKESKPPDINGLASSNLPGTLEALKKAVSADAFKAFEEWRHATEGITTWAPSKADYFLAGEEYGRHRQRLAAAVHWQLLKQDLGKLYRQMSLDAAKKAKLEEVLRAHVQKVSAFAAAQKVTSLQAPTNRQKIKEMSAATELKVAEVLGSGGMAKFRTWKASPGLRSCVYFGLPFTQPTRPPGMAPRPPQPRETPAPGQDF